MPLIPVKELCLPTLMASISLKWHFLGWQRWWSKSKLLTNLVNTSICNSFWKKRLPAKKCLYVLRFNSNLGYTKTQLLFVGNSSWPRNLWNFFVFVRWSKQIHPPFRISCQSIQLLPGFFGMFVDIYVFGTLPWKFNYGYPNFRRASGLSSIYYN